MFDVLLLEIDKTRKENTESERSLEAQYVDFLKDFIRYEDSLKKESSTKDSDDESFGRPYKVQ